MTRSGRARGRDKQSDAAELLCRQLPNTRSCRARTVLRGVGFRTRTTPLQRWRLVQVAITYRVKSSAVAEMSHLRKGRSGILVQSECGDGIDLNRSGGGADA